MAQQIIKQPNGRYCIFSSIADNITHYNLNKEHIVEILVKEERCRIEKYVGDVIDKIEKKGGNPHSHFSLSYEEMLKLILEVHSVEEMESVKSAIGGG